jgi:hypothetical protein
MNILKMIKGILPKNDQSKDGESSSTVTYNFGFFGGSVRKAYDFDNISPADSVDNCYEHAVKGHDGHGANPGETTGADFFERIESATNARSYTEKVKKAVKDDGFTKINNISEVREGYVAVALYTFYHPEGSDYHFIRLEDGVLHNKLGMHPAETIPRNEFPTWVFWPKRGERYISYFR